MHAIYASLSIAEEQRQVATAEARFERQRSLPPREPKRPSAKLELPSKACELPSKLLSKACETPSASTSDGSTSSSSPPCSPRTLAVEEHGTWLAAPTPPPPPPSVAERSAYWPGPRGAATFQAGQAAQWQARRHRIRCRLQLEDVRDPQRRWLAHEELAAGVSQSQQQRPSPLGETRPSVRPEIPAKRRLSRRLSLISTSLRKRARKLTGGVGRRSSSTSRSRSDETSSEVCLVT